MPVDDHGGSDGLAGDVGQIPDGARRYLRILRTNSAIDFGRRQVEASQFGGVDPDAHGALGTKQLGLTDTGNALQFGQHVARGVVTQRHDIEVRVVRRQHGEQQKVRSRLIDPNAGLRHCRWQAWCCARQPVLYIHLGQIGIGAGFKGQRQIARAICLGDRLHVNQSGRTVHFALDDTDHRVFESLG